MLSFFKKISKYVCRHCLIFTAGTWELDLFSLQGIDRHNCWERRTVADEPSARNTLQIPSVCHGLSYWCRWERLAIPTPAAPLETQRIVNTARKSSWTLLCRYAKYLEHWYGSGGTLSAFVPIHVPSNNILMIKGPIVFTYTLWLEMDFLKT